MLLLCMASFCPGFLNRSSPSVNTNGKDNGGRKPESSTPTLTQIHEASPWNGLFQKIMRKEPEHDWAFTQERGGPPDDAGPSPREPGAGWAADAGQQLTRCPLILVIWTDFPTPTPP